MEELIPEAIRVEHLSLSAIRMTSGGSSGGCCAFNACWYRNDYFRRAYLASPSFFALASADEFITYTNKCEPRSIRVYFTFDEIEPVAQEGRPGLSRDLGDRGVQRPMEAVHRRSTASGASTIRRA